MLGIRTRERTTEVADLDRHQRRVGVGTNCRPRIGSGTSGSCGNASNRPIDVTVSGTSVDHRRQAWSMSDARSTGQNNAPA